MSDTTTTSNSAESEAAKGIVDTLLSAYTNITSGFHSDVTLGKEDSPFAFISKVFKSQSINFILWIFVFAQLAYPYILRFIGPLRKQAIYFMGIEKVQESVKELIANGGRLFKGFNKNKELAY